MSSFPMPWCRLGWCWVGVGHVGLPVAGSALGVHPPQVGLSDKVSPPVEGGLPDAVPFSWAGSRRLGWRAGGARVGQRGGRRQRGSLGRPSPGLPAWTRLAARMRSVVPEVWRRSSLLVFETPEVLLYCCEVVKGVRVGRCGG